MKFTTVILSLILTCSAFATTMVGGITSNDLKNVGVSEKNIGMVHDIVESAIKKSKVLSLEKKKMELEIQKLLLDNPEKNWNNISKLFDEIGKVEAGMKRNKLKSQIALKKYISDDQYKNAREIALKRYKDEPSLNIKIKSGKLPVKSK